MPYFVSYFITRHLVSLVRYAVGSVRVSRPAISSEFCRLELGGEVPEASTLGRVRTQLVAHGL